MKWANALIVAWAVAIGLYWVKQPGFLFLLDYVTGPTIPAPHIDATGLISGMAIQAAGKLLSFIAPPEAITKILITIALAIAGIGASNLSYYISRSQSIAFACGLFYMLNPFIGNRIIMGHIYLLFGYALLPALVLLLLQYFNIPSRKKAIGIGILAGGIIAISIHYIVLIPIAIVCVALQYNRQRIPRAHMGIMLAPSLLVCIAIAAVASNTPPWTGYTLREFSSEVFALRPYCSKYVLPDTLALIANWKTPLTTIFSCTVPILFWSATAILVIGAIAGSSLYWIALLYIASILLALGIIPLPWWTGMRDAGKFLGLAAFAQTLLITNGKQRFLTPFVIAASIIIAISTTGTMVQTLTAQQYPPLWKQWNERFSQHTEKPIVLFLPWQQYIALPFTNSLPVANPAPVFFTNATVISGDNIQLARNGVSIPSVSNNPRSKEIEMALAAENEQEFLSRLHSIIQKEHISYIMMTPISPKDIAMATTLDKWGAVSRQTSNTELNVWKIKQ